MKMFEIHPSAKANFDTKVSLLVKSISAIPRAAANRARFDSEIFIAAKITEQDIVGELKESQTDYTGRIVGRFFTFEETRYGLQNEAHDELTRLAEAILRLPAFRDCLSNNFVEECMFSWLQGEYKDPGKSASFLTYLVSEASKVVKPTSVLVPIANTIVEMPFNFCGAIISNLTKEVIDEMMSVGESLPEEQKQNVAVFFEKFRKQFQGYAVVEVNLNCEPKFASKFAIDIARRVTSLLGIYSGAVLMPDVKSVSKIKGTENLSSYTTVIRGGDGGVLVDNGILDMTSAKLWSISKSDLNAFSQCGLDKISSIETKEGRSEFETTVLNMAFLYSKAAFTSDPMEKLVHMLSALESTLLRNESEPIQQNLAERLAFFTAHELQERKEIIKNVKHVYGLRSRYLHHGHSSSDLAELCAFFQRVWIFYVQLVVNSGQFKTKIEFLDAIDDHKLS